MLGTGLALAGLIGLSRHEIQDPNDTLLTVDEGFVPIVDFELPIDKTNLGALALFAGGAYLTGSGIKKPDSDN